MTHTLQVCATSPIFDGQNRYSFQGAYVEAWAKASNKGDRWSGGIEGKVTGKLRSNPRGHTWLVVCIELSFSHQPFLKLGAI